jgi:hypothetical protein
MVYATTWEIFNFLAYVSKATRALYAIKLKIYAMLNLAKTVAPVIKHHLAFTFAIVQQVIYK